MRTIVDISPPGNSSSAQSPSEPKPIRVEKPEDPSKMQIVPAYKQEMPFDLPDDWIVEVRPRANSRSDKYYYEPETGRKFRSLASARRYLNGEQEPQRRKRQNNSQIVPYQNAEVFKGVMFKGKVLRPDQLGEVLYSNLEEIYPRNLQFQNSSVLPDGWIVEFHPRANTKTKHIDRYFLEPGTGRKFRSLTSVVRHLTGEEDLFSRPKQNNCLVPYHNSGVSRRIVYGGKWIQVTRPDELEEARFRKPQAISPQASRFSSVTTLPDGWILEDVLRKDGFKTDRYYIEPVTGQRFRSAPEAHRYLAAQNYKVKSKALAITNYPTAPRSTLPRKRSTKIKICKNSTFDPSRPVEKINWVYSGDGKDNWTPLVEECMLPNYVKEQWSETFMLGMSGWKCRVPQLTMKEDNNRAPNA